MLKACHTTAATVILLATVAAAACSSEGGPPAGRDYKSVSGLLAQAKDDGLGPDHPTVKRLSDGVVTLEEYRAAMGDTVECYKNHGLAVSTPYINRMDSWRLMWSVTSDTTKISLNQQQNIVGACDGEFNLYVTLGYSLRHLDRLDARMLAASRPCFTAKHLTIPEGTMALRDIDAAAGKDRQIARNCLLAAKDRLYPKEDIAIVEG